LVPEKTEEMKGYEPGNKFILEKCKKKEKAEVP